MDLIKIEKDMERAKSLLQLSELRCRKLSSFDITAESSLLAESYYEIIKELITAILFAEGYKTLSHKDLVEYLKVNYSKDFEEHDIECIDKLRKRRNHIVYYGKFVQADYLKRNSKNFDRIIKKLKEILIDNITHDKNKKLALPRDDLMKQEILTKIAQRFDKDKKYSEQEVNEIIKSFYVEDHVLVRRELVNFNYFGKDSYKGKYWIKSFKLSREELQRISKTQQRIREMR